MVYMMRDRDAMARMIERCKAARCSALVLGMLGARRHTFRNLVGHVEEVTDVKSLASWTNEQFDPQLSWADVESVKRRWGS